MATPTSAFGNGPGNLGSPVPGKDEQADLAAAATEFMAKQKQTPVESAGDDLAAAAQQFKSQLAPAPADVAMEAATGAVPNADVIPDPSFAQANFSIDGIKQQLGDLSIRARQAWTMTDRESLNDLKKSGLFQDVRVGDNGKIQIKRKGAAKFENFDKGTAELIGDTVDLTRMIFEGVAETGVRAIGAVEGAAAGAPAGPLGMLGGGFIGQAAAGAGGSIAAREAGDAYAQNVLGIEKDPSRSRTVENTVAGISGAVFGPLSNIAERRAAESLMRRDAFAATSDMVEKNVVNAVDAVNDVKKAGISMEEFRLDPNQAAGDVMPEFKEISAKLSSDPRVKNFMIHQKKVLGEAWDSLVQMVGNTTGKAVGKGRDFVLQTKDVRNFEGQVLGKFRDAAEANSGGRAQPLPRLNETLNKALETVGMRNMKTFTQVTPKVLSEYTGIVKQELPELSDGQARYYAHTLAKWQGLMNRRQGTLPLSEIRKEYTGLTNRIDALMKSQNGRDLGHKLIDIKNALRDDWTASLGKNLPAGMEETYKGAMKRYSTVVKGSEALAGVLKNENISKEALADYLFSGNANLNRIKAVKSLYQDTNPEMWRDLAGQYMTKLQNEHTTFDKLSGVRTVNWGGVQKSFNKLGKEVREELYQGTGLNDNAIGSLAALGKAVEKADVGFTPNALQRGLIKRMFVLVGGGATARGGALENIIDGLGRDKSVGIWLKEGGATEILKQFPEGKAKRMWTRVLDRYNPNLGKVRRQAGSTSLRKFGERHAPGSANDAPMTSEVEE